jgi:hypothetical protein
MMGSLPGLKRHAVKAAPIFATLLKVDFFHLLLFHL